MCLARGTVPCDVLFVGEAPGESENVLGQPFKGPAGQLLDRIIDQSIGAANQLNVRDGKPAIRWAFTNLVGCIPRDDDGGKAAEPWPEEIRKCAPRLHQFISICSPQILVCVGSLSKRWIGHVYKGDVIEIVHPAAILRSNVAMRGIAVRRCIVTLTDAMEGVVPGARVAPKVVAINPDAIAQTESAPSEPADDIPF